MPVQKYKDYSLGVRLRITTGNLFSSFASPDHLFFSDHIRNLLLTVFKFKDYEVSVELMQMLAFGKNKYRNLALEELISYLLQKYVGEKAIAKYGRAKKYQMDAEKCMNQHEFLETIELGLSFIEDRDVQSDRVELQKMFQEIAYGKQTITFKEYTSFLREYFGSESPMVLNPTEHAIKLQSQEMLPEQWSQQPKYDPQNVVKQTKREEKEVGFMANGTTALQQLRDLIVSQIGFKCSQLDGDMDQKLTKQETFTFFYQILLLERHSIQYILENYFNFVQKESIGFAQIIEVIGQVHYRQIFSSLLKQETDIDNPNKIIMNNEYFNQKVVEACFFFKNKPNYSLLSKVFAQLVARSDLKDQNLVSLEDFRSFILAFVCNKRLIFRKHSRKNTPTAANLPLSIAEVSNSNFQQDSQYAQVRPKQFELSINDYKIEQNALDHRFIESDGKFSPNKISGLSFINKQSSNINTPKEINFRSQVSIKESEGRELPMKERLTFLEHISGTAYPQQQQLFTSIQRQTQRQNTSISNLNQNSSSDQPQNIIIQPKQNSNSQQQENSISYSKQNIIRQNLSQNIRQNSIRQNIRQSSIRQNIRENISRQNIRENISRQNIRLSSAKQINVRQNTIRQNSITENCIRENSARENSFREISVRQNASQHRVEPEDMKDKLWVGLAKNVRKYSRNGETLSYNQASSFLQNELAFTIKFKDFPKKVTLFFARNTQPPIERFLSYVIHLLAEQSLAQFNKTQIQGKFVLNEQELSKLLFIAYGNFQHMTGEQCLTMSRKLIRECNRPKFTYTTWLLTAKNILATY